MTMTSTFAIQVALCQFKFQCERVGIWRSKFPPCLPLLMHHQSARQRSSWRHHESRHRSHRAATRQSQTEPPSLPTSSFIIVTGISSSPGFAQRHRPGNLLDRKVNKRSTRTSLFLPSLSFKHHQSIPSINQSSHNSTNPTQNKHKPQKWLSPHQTSSRYIFLHNPLPQHLSELYGAQLVYELYGTNTSFPRSSSPSSSLL